ncbi:MAG TPA: transglutaminase family protein [Pirellulales bacterium]|jgi:hypothetical protein|nr:transglutaminase family protein [Pirellulales bacterium]
MAILALPALALCGGCSPAESSSSSVDPPISVAPESSGRSEMPGEALRPHVNGDPQEQWFAMFIQGVKVGHGWTSESRLVDHGKPLLRIDEQVNFSVNRNGQRTDEKIKSTGIETLDGEPLRIETEINSGQEPIVTKAKIRDGQITFQTMTTGKTLRTSIPWPAGAGGFKATEHSLARQPMQPGQRRKLSGLMLGFNQVAEIELVSTAYEPTMLLDHSEDLLRIDWTATLPKGDIIRSVWWTNHDGEVLKMQIDALHQVTYRTTREIAMAEAGAARFDLLLSTIVCVDRPLDHAQNTRRVRYRVRLESEDPSHVFASGGTQRVTPIDVHTAEIVVRSIRPGRPAPDFAPGDAALPAGGGTPSDPSRERPPADDDRQPNNLVQSDAPRIVELAKRAAGQGTDAWETAAALERFVHQYVVAKDYLKAFSTAVEVADSREGACSQHAVLLAALARSRGIPARVAIGLVYVDDHPGFAFHMWNEVWIGDRWIPLDATRGLGGIGAAYLKLTDSSLQGEAAYSCFLPVSQVIGQAKIEILDAE